MKKKNTAPYHHGDLRSALVSTARTMVERDGPDAVSLRGVANEANVSRAAPYHHFKDKQALLAAVAAEGFREFTSNMLAKVKETSPPREQLDQLGFGYIEYGILHPELFRLMQGPSFQQPGVDNELDDARDESAQPLIKIVSECMLGATQETILQGCAAAWSIVHGMTALSIDGRMQAIVDIGVLQNTAYSITRQLNLEALGN